MLLDGIRVVELAVWVAAPGAGGVLADWGADVIKVEPPEGDPCRRLFGALAGLKVVGSPPFDLDNRGKRSVVLDTRSRAGREAVRRLVRDADVFLTNLRPEALRSMGLDYAALAEDCPRLVYASVTGYGIDGPDRDRAAYDVGAFWARAGGAHLIVPEGAEPPGIRGGFGDHVTAITTVSGVLGALLQRERTGRGQRVRTSLLRTGMYCVGWDLGIRLRYGRLASTLPRTAALNPVMNSYRAGDGRWFWLLGLEAERHWPKLVRVVERPDLERDERFASAAARRHHATDLVALLDDSFGKRPLAEWAERFDAEDLWFAPVQTPDEVVEDEQAHAAGAFVEVPEADGSGSFRAVASPVDFEAADTGPQGPVPALGEHTLDVLREAGFAPDEIEALGAAASIAPDAIPED
jgi:crotonobetainyl-CoA:carnitine CoA-transferase CaiB-like acyl-CoA transferase